MKICSVRYLNFRVCLCEQELCSKFTYGLISYVISIARLRNMLHFDILCLVELIRLVCKFQVCSHVLSYFHSSFVYILYDFTCAQIKFKD
jgi:hypothetical protein